MRSMIVSQTEQHIRFMTAASKNMPAGAVAAATTSERIDDCRDWSALDDDYESFSDCSGYSWTGSLAGSWC